MCDARERAKGSSWWAAARAPLFVAALAALPLAARAQDGPEARPAALVNGGLEELDASGKLAGWFVPASLVQAGYRIGPESGDAFAGKGAARIDSREVTAAGSSFGNLLQSFDATPWRGKRVVYRAAVKVAEGADTGRAQLWLRVDLAASGGTPRTGFFDNMQDRPIQSSDWKTYEIVGDVAEDAQSIVLGVLTLGPCVVLVDEATFELAKEGARKTGYGADEDAPRQEFFTAWLWLPVVALVSFALAYLGRGRAGKLAFEFTFAYWVLYTFVSMLQSIVPFVGRSWGAALETGPIDALVRWAAPALLGIEGELVSAINNGSGDSTYSHVQTFLNFALALVLASVWSLVDRRATGHPWLKDLLRSLLRYWLAMFMVTYGLAKLVSIGNQFSETGTWRLTQTYGQSSPMGLLWTFMGSSRVYTNFAGAMELLGGFLLVWRRTVLLGSLVSVGVMLNVMLMNFCYDVPVKLFSLHLVVAALVIALPDAGRLCKLFLGVDCRAAPPLGYPFTSRAGTWIHRALKAGLVVMVLGLPLYEFWRAESSTAGVRPALGEWKLVALEVDGEKVEPEAGEVLTLTLSPQLTPTPNGWMAPCNVTLVGGTGASVGATLTPERVSFEAASGSTSRILSGDSAWSVVDGELRLESAHVHARFAPAVDDYLLMRRGFRWINEHPFNR